MATKFIYSCASNLLYPWNPSYGNKLPSKIAIGHTICEYDGDKLTMQEDNDFIPFMLKIKGINNEEELLTFFKEKEEV